MKKRVELRGEKLSYIKKESTENDWEREKLLFQWKNSSRFERKIFSSFCYINRHSFIVCELPSCVKECFSLDISYAYTICWRNCKNRENKKINFSSATNRDINQVRTKIIRRRRKEKMSYTLAIRIIDCHREQWASERKTVEWRFRLWEKNEWLINNTWNVDRKCSFSEVKVYEWRTEQHSERVRCW